MLMATMTRSLALAALAVVSMTTLPGVQAYRPGDETCVVSEDSPCAVGDLKTSDLDGSTLVYPGGATRCAFDDFSHPDADFVSNATFFFQVFPNEEKDDSKLLIYLQGGGACIDDDTCNFELQCSASPSTTFNQNAAALSTGVLNRTDSNNYFHDWNIVHVPYCTGDLHFGNGQVEPKKSVFANLLGQDACQDQGMTMHMNGFTNADSAFKWAQTNFPSPKKLVFAGSSAGALGTQLMSKYVADMWDVKAQSIEYTVLADSYVGVVPDDKPAGILVNYFNACSLDFGLPQNVVEMCENDNATVVDFVSSMLEATSFSEWFFLDSMADKTQRKFYELFDKGILGYPFKDLVDKDVFYEEMTEILDAYKAEDGAHVSTFFVEGEHHVFLNNEKWYDVKRSQNKDKLGDVLAKVIENADIGSKGEDGSAPAPSSGTRAAMHAVMLCLALIATLML